MTTRLSADHRATVPAWGGRDSLHTADGQGRRGCLAPCGRASLVVLSDPFVGAPEPMPFVLWILCIFVPGASSSVTPALRPLTFDDLVTRVDRLPYNAPTHTNSLTAVARGNVTRQRAIARFADETCLFVHAEVLQLAAKFLDFKREHGTSVEKRLYANMTAWGLLVRVATHRPLVFMDVDDKYRLRTGETGQGPAKWLAIGTEAEQPPLLLQSYMSYSEMQVLPLPCWLFDLMFPGLLQLFPLLLLLGLLLLSMDPPPLGVHFAMGSPQWELGLRPSVGEQ